MPDPDVYDHYRSTDDDYPDGVYRVVGTGDAITLLRVADADGRRVHTGEVQAVDRDALDGFEPAENPDGNRSLVGVIAAAPRTVYWQFRAFGASLADHPIPAALALALVLVGEFGERWLPGDAAGAVLIVVGALVMSYVGSGRL